MKIKDLPKEIQKLADKRRSEQRPQKLIYDGGTLFRYFDWFKTPEGSQFWYEINEGKYEQFYEKYPQPMIKEIKIEIPEGYEIDQEKSIFENIVFKKEVIKLPKSVDEIESRKWFISDDSSIRTYNYNKVSDKGKYFRNQVSTEQRAEAFLALMQLVELRDAWNDGKTPEIKEGQPTDFYATIHIVDGKIKKGWFHRHQFILRFTTEELRNRFLEQFRDLIETAKELL